MRTNLALLVTAAILVAALPGPPGSAQAAPERVGGQDRYATAAAVSAVAFPAGAEVAWVATGEDFPDALAAAAATAGGAPLLLTGRDALPAATADELRRLEPERIVLLGGQAAVAAPVAAALGDLAPGGVSRLAGPDRYATAAAASAATSAPGARVAYVATGEEHADALAASAGGGPVLLTAPDRVPAATRTELARLRPADLVVLGGEQAVPGALMAELEAVAGVPARRLAGPDRFATAAAVAADAFPDGAPLAVLASGRAFPDALAGATAAAAGDGPVLLVEPGCVPDPVRAELARLAPARLLLVGGPVAVGPAVERLGGCGLATSVVAGGLTLPWDVVVAPDGRVFVSESDSGRVLVLAPGGGELREVHRLAVDPEGEGGLLGLAVSPGFAQDGLLYAYLTTARDNRIVRFRPGDPAEPQPVLTGIPAGRIHNGGRIAFGPDGMLYAGTGDAGDSRLAPDPASLGGKILRVRPDGTVPDGNPAAGSPVWSRGHRNVQGLAWDGEGRLYASEFGPDRDDELNLIVPGGDHGWPEVTGVAGRPGLVDPVAVRQPSEASWSGLALLSGGAIGAWEGDLFAAGLRGRRLWRFDLAPDGTVAGSEALLVGEFGRLRAVRQAPDGALWMLTGNGDDDRLLRLGPPPP